MDTESKPVSEVDNIQKHTRKCAPASNTVVYQKIVFVDLLATLEGMTSEKLTGVKHRHVRKLEQIADEISRLTSKFSHRCRARLVKDLFCAYNPSLRDACCAA